ncbi:hypothetical protein LS70_005810 [Helicobacter sp. MIT 11-5569]|uniref:hypothetical protein n=1 Tax=Helicobacter sp. MIT 11-5569 TaxID=1548151 RepID=UPI00051FC12F|nr:hypothetical protein [Helicobacter sp. MIT 11-5569]TLD83262.1 hypothetical protein LS70_005810 [Helicobacter sp. MIT 11-5569]
MNNIRYKMKAIKKDFVEPDTESFCGRKKLTSGKAYFLVNEDGKTFMAGTQCAMQYSQTDLSSVPDFTTSLLVNFTKDSQGIHASSHLITKQQEQNKKSLALTYLLLREEILKELDFINVSYPSLQSYYQEYLKNGNISQEAMKHICNLMVVQKKFKKFCLENLLTCYAYHYKMKKALQYTNEEGINYINSLLTYLKRRYHLTKDQISGLSNWFQHIKCKEIREAKLKNFVFQG